MKKSNNSVTLTLTENLNDDGSFSCVEVSLEYSGGVADKSSVAHLMMMNCMNHLLEMAEETGGRVEQVEEDDE